MVNFHIGNINSTLVITWRNITALSQTIAKWVCAAVGNSRLINRASGFASKVSETEVITLRTEPKRWQWVFIKGALCKLVEGWFNWRPVQSQLTKKMKWPCNLSVSRALIMKLRAYYMFLSAESKSVLNQCSAILLRASLSNLGNWGWDS